MGQPSGMNGTLEQFIKGNEETRKQIDSVFKCRERYLCDQQDSSVGSKNPDCSHIFYFDACKAQEIYLDREHGISIYPEFLARAFLHKDVYSIAKELSSAIFTKYDLKGRKDLSLNPVEALRALPIEKRNCIIRLTKWIFDKKQCPWKISAKKMKTLQGFSLEKNETELLDIFLAFLTFDHISEYRYEGLNAETPDLKYIEWLNQFTPDLNNVTSSPDSIDPHGTPQTVLYQRRTENLFFEDIFRKIIAEINKAYQCQSPFSNVDLVRVLTKLTIPDCEDVFSDAAQFSLQRWRQSKTHLTDKGPVKAADNLFRKFWRLDFRNKTFFDLDKDFCPVKFLAITRAIAKLQYNETEENHDRFLDWETISEIKAFLNQKYKGQNSSPESPPSSNNESEVSSSTMKNSMAQSQSIIEEEIKDSSEHPGIETWKILVSSGKWKVLLSVDNIGNVSVDQPVPQLPPPSPQPQVTPSEHGTINYYFDSDKNLILPTMNNMTVGPEIWKYVNGLGARGTVPVNVVRGEVLFDRLLTSEEKLMQFSSKNNMPIYPPHKLNAILAILAILKEITEKKLDVESLVNCRGPFVNKLTDSDIFVIITKVFQSYGSRHRRAQKKRKMDDDGAKPSGDGNGANV